MPTAASISDVACVPTCLRSRNAPIYPLPFTIYGVPYLSIVLHHTTAERLLRYKRSATPAGPEKYSDTYNSKKHRYVQQSTNRSKQQQSSETPRSYENSYARRNRNTIYHTSSVLPTPDSRLPSSAPSLLMLLLRRWRGTSAADPQCLAGTTSTLCFFRFVFFGGGGGASGGSTAKSDSPARVGCGVGERMVR